MKTCYIHKDPLKERTKKIFLIMLLLSFSYGFYKNNLLYYFLHKVPLSSIFEPIYILGIGILLSSLYFILQKKKNILDMLLLGFFLTLLIPPTLPILWFTVYTSIFLLVSLLLKKCTMINKLVFYKVGLIALSFFLQIGLENSIEQSSLYYYGIVDVFLGRGLGGFGTTSIFLSIIAYFLFWTDFYYKKELPLYAIASYTILFFLFYFLFPLQYTLSAYLNPSIFFPFVFLLPDNASSPATSKSQVMYGMSIGALSFFFIHYGKIMEGGYLAIAIINILYLIIHYSYYYFCKRMSKKCKE